jgi:membrane protein implicated in regulation of membrane protease activity
MGIGGSIFLLALGAILAFAVNADISGIDITIVGYVLMLAGLAGLIITVWYWNSRRRSTTVSNTQRPVMRGDGTYVNEYRETRQGGDPPPPPAAY